MKKIITKITIFSTLLFTLNTSCSLDVEVYDQLTADNVLNTESDVKAAVTGAYNWLRSGGWSGYNCAWGSLLTMQVGCTDEVDCNFLWDAQTDFLWKPETNDMSLFYKQMTPAITSITSLLERMKPVAISAPLKRRYTAELRALRALIAYDLYDLYGAVPIITDPKIALNPIEAEKLKPVRPTTEWYVNFLIKELSESQENLLTARTMPTEEYGHLTEGVAQMYLIKLFMHEAGQERYYRNNEAKAMVWWDKVDSITNVMINSGNYELQKEYMSIWSPRNQKNKEIIFPIPCFPVGGWGNIFLAETLPADYVSKAGVPLTKWGGFLSTWESYDSYDPADKRRAALVKDYWNGKKMVNRRTDKITGKSAPFPMKYQENPNTTGQWDGSEYVINRYAEVILARAEALNEKEGPTQRVKDLIHSVRTRAFDNYKGSIQEKLVNDISSKDAMRDHLLNERRWEFIWEGMRRPDLIRHNKLITNAHNRGKSFASDKHLLYPIPQSVRYESPTVDQNPGYDTAE